VKCAKCLKDKPVTFKRFGSVKGTSMKRYRALCQNCLESLKEDATNAGKKE
jgi:hypothetical protein